MQPILHKRRAGIILHPTSLPRTPDNGDIGHEAYRFVEFLSASGMSLWQTLPLGPTHKDGSPYQCLSVHAGNPLLISLDWLRDRGWLQTDVPFDPLSPTGKYRLACLRAAHEGFRREYKSGGTYSQAYDHFTESQSNWLEDYALYMAIRMGAGEYRAWMDWPAPIRDREVNALKEARFRLAKEIDRIKFEQFVFFEQWRELKAYAHRHGVLMFGDMPIFVAFDSAEVWAHREYFAVDEHGRAKYVAGVPPDYFSETGQWWGNPHYNWDIMDADGFDWWIRRMRTQLEFFDLVRIDHFRGFEAYWEIPVDAENAQQGRWVKAPGKALLMALHEAFDRLPVIAEDLGTITPEVDALREAFNIPGMKVLQFAFDSNRLNPYLPHCHENNTVVYTGTHDNDTTLGWYESLSPETQTYVWEYLGHPQEPMPWPLIRCALGSVAQLAVLPMQDVLSLGSDCRMNMPGTIEGNWQWRYSWGQVDVELSARLAKLVELYGRKRLGPT